MYRLVSAAIFHCKARTLALAVMQSRVMLWLQTLAGRPPADVKIAL